MIRETRKINQSGFTLIEVVIVIIVTGILVAVAMNSGQHITDTARTEETKQELEALAKAIIGNPDLQNGGIRTDYGYVGDIGAMPSTLADLYTNPGSYATWNGPYISNRFSQVSDDYNRDAWGTAYTYGGGVSVTSTGSGSNIVRNLVGSTDHLLFNSLSGTSLDKDGKPPGMTYRDSVEIQLTFPDGAGSTTTKTTNPDAGGLFSIDSIPIGNHSLKVIYLPTSDTLRRYVSLSPNTSPYEGYFLGTSVFGSGGGGGGGASPEILRPMGAGTTTTLLDENCSGNWSCVDEATSDGDGTFVKGAGGSWDNDTYATENSAVGAGTIDSVVVYIRVKNFRARVALRTGGTLYESSDINVAGSYTDYSRTWITNPKTSSAWTWTEIDAMEIGVTIKESGKCTQVWAEVHFTP